MEQLKIGQLITQPLILLDERIIGDSYHVIATNLDDEKYNDITNNQNWVEIGIKYYDYKFCRAQMALYTYNIGFNNLSQIEKEYAAKHFVVSKSDRDSVFSEPEQQFHWGNFMSESKLARSYRLNAAKNYISYVLPMADSIDISQSTKLLNENYLEYGFESIAIDGVDGIWDWIENTGNFTSNGFDSKSYWSQERQNKLMIILRDGIY